MNTTQNPVVNEVAVALGREVRNRVAEPVEDLQPSRAGEGAEYLGRGAWEPEGYVGHRSGFHTVGYVSNI